MGCLQQFCNGSGQRVSFQKSSILFSKTVNTTVAEEISNISGIPVTTNLGNPSIHGRMQPELYQNLLDRINSRLEGWKTKHLSLPGRNVIPQSVLSSITLYSLQSTFLPKALCSRIDRMIRNFTWGDLDEKKKFHLVNWETITRLKEHGG